MTVTTGAISWLSRWLDRRDEALRQRVEADQRRVEEQAALRAQRREELLELAWGLYVTGRMFKPDKVAFCDVLRRFVTPAALLLCALAACGDRARLTAPPDEAVAATNAVSRSTSDTRKGSSGDPAPRKPEPKCPDPRRPVCTVRLAGARGGL